MVERGRGGIALVSSNGAIAGAVNFSTYNAGKAFEWILAETLWTERSLSPGWMSRPSSSVRPPRRTTLRSRRPWTLSFAAGDTDDALDRARARLMNPNPPEQVASALFDQLGSGPVGWADPDDAFVSRKCLAMPRDEAVAVWRGVQETSTRIPERQAL